MISATHRPLLCGGQGAGGATRPVLPCWQNRRLLRPRSGVYPVTVRPTPANLVIVAVLVFQLAIGLHWQMMHAAVLPAQLQAAGAEAAEHCPAHQAKPPGSAEAHGATVSPHAASLHHGAGHQHECCLSPGCQCHCAQSPMSVGLRVTRLVTPATVSPVLDARTPTTRANELFRPPIA